MKKVLIGIFLLALMTCSAFAVTGPTEDDDKNLDELRVKLVRMIRLRDEDLVQIFHRSSGPGGQHVNKVSTAVTLKHIPTGLIVTASDSRSQSQNRALARERLEGKLAESARKKKLADLAEASRERRRKAKRSRGTKARMVESKRRRSETKNLRGKVRTVH